MKPLMINGRLTMAETNARHLRVVMSAMTICVNNCSPLRTGEAGKAEEER